MSDNGHPRVLVQLGGIPLHGQERGNIQVFHALKDVGVQSLFVTHSEYGHESIQPALDRLGHEWTVCTYPGRLSRGLGVRGWLRRLREICRGNIEFYRAGRRYDPTHIHVCNEGHLLVLLPAVVALRRAVIFRVGDAPRQHRWIFRALWRAVYPRVVHRFITVSDYVAEQIQRAGVPRAQIRRVYSHPQDRPDPDDLSWLGGSAGASRGDERLRSLAGRHFEGRTFVYMGQLNPEKGVDLIVSAALKLCRERSDVRFLIAGDYIWENPFARALMQKVEVAGMHAQIVFLGYVENIHLLLDLADVHLCPTLTEEPLSNTVVEAKAAGVPSIVFPSGGLPEIVESGVDGFVVQERTRSALEAALESYLDMPDAVLERQKEAARRSLSRMGITRQAFARAWADVYASC